MFSFSPKPSPKTCFDDKIVSPRSWVVENNVEELWTKVLDAMVLPMLTASLPREASLAKTLNSGGGLHADLSKLFVRIVGADVSRLDRHAFYENFVEFLDGLNIKPRIAKKEQLKRSLWIGRLLERKEFEGPRASLFRSPSGQLQIKTSRVGGHVWKNNVGILLIPPDLHLSPNPAEVLKAARQNLAPGGSVLLIVPVLSPTQLPDPSFIYSALEPRQPARKVYTTSFTEKSVAAAQNLNSLFIKMPRQSQYAFSCLMEYVLQNGIIPFLEEKTPAKKSPIINYNFGSVSQLCSILQELGLTVDSNENVKNIGIIDPLRPQFLAAIRGWAK